MAIVKANYITRGKKAAKAARQAAKYYTFRDGPDRAGRVWQADDRRTLPYADVSDAVAAGAKDARYTYRVVLSTRDADIGAEGYHQILAGHFTHYYFVEHHNTDYPHAHVIGFRGQRVKKGELQALRGKLLELEQAQVQQQHRVLDNEVGLPGSQPVRQERARDDGLELG